MRKAIANRVGLIVISLMVTQPAATKAPADCHPDASPAASIYGPLKACVLNRGVAPDAFLQELIAWGKSAPDEIFAPRQGQDVYASVAASLGPYNDALHRRAVMLEVLRVLAGFESSWHWNAGVDTTNPTSNTPLTMEAGAWQVSANSMVFGPELKQLAQARIGSFDPVKFQQTTKADHSFAMEYAARLLRRTVKANGPVKRHEIDRWLRRDAVEKFVQLLEPK